MAIYKKNKKIKQVYHGDRKIKAIYHGNRLVHNSNRFGGRYWDNNSSDPTATGYYGDLSFLQNLPSILGLGCYLVQDDGTRKKLDPNNHYKFIDGADAALDGSMGQYMWCWNAHYYSWWEKDDNYYEVVSTTPIENVECYYIPAGGTSALGGGVVDRADLKLCSIINDDVRYRGGDNSSNFVDDQYKSLLGKPATDIAFNVCSEYARKRNVSNTAYWEANWFISRAVQEYLFRIIMGTRHSQAAYNASKDSNGLYQGGLGNGVTTLSSAEWKEWSDRLSQPPVPTSVGVELGDGVGEVNYDLLNRDGTVFKTVYVPVFFGLKNMYGHLWQVVRGLIYDLKSSDSYVYVCPSIIPVQDNANVSGMIQAGKVLDRNTIGYIKKMSMQNLCNVPTEIGGISTTYYSDYFWANNGSGLRSRLAGGVGFYGAESGLGACSANTTVAAIATATTSPLCYFTEDPSPISVNNI